MELQANAKINLCLDVVKKREDGYHEMDMIMVPLDLHDTIWIERSDADQYECINTDMVIDEHNTIVKAAKFMKQTFALHDHFAIQVEKHIPMEAGMAGGSADAAAVMKGIWQLCKLPCSLEELAYMGKAIGADVPFCVMNTCALVRGIGEVIQPFTQRCKFHVLLVKPHQGVSTKEAFRLLDFEKCKHPQTLQCKEALACGDTEKFYHNSGNTLEYSAFQMVPELRQIQRELTEIGFPFVLMSGSGSTMFALSEEEQLLHIASQKLKYKYPFVVETKIL